MPGHRNFAPVTVYHLYTHSHITIPEPPLETNASFFFFPIKGNEQDLTLSRGYLVFGETVPACSNHPPAWSPVSPLTYLPCCTLVFYVFRVVLSLPMLRKAQLGCPKGSYRSPLAITVAHGVPLSTPLLLHMGKRTLFWARQVFSIPTVIHRHYNADIFATWVPGILSQPILLLLTFLKLWLDAFHFLAK